MHSLKQSRAPKVRLCIVGLFVVFGIAFSATQLFRYESAFANGGLVAWWKLDEGSGTTALDSSGNGRNGTLTNVTYSEITPTVEFANPHSAYFNQSSSGRIITTPLSLNNYTEFTMTGWAYPTRADERASWFGQNDLFEFGFTDGDTLFCYTSKGEVSWDFNPGTFLNQWHHITCLATSTQLIVYIDGVNVASTNIESGSFGSSGSNFTIGAGAVDGGDSGPFTGYIDDVRVYSRGLTPSEMAAIGTGSTGPTNGPNVSISSPEDDTAINSWNPSINWGNADTCEYKLNDDPWETADCSLTGSDISSPEEGANQTLFIRGYYDDVEDPGTASSAFDFDMTAPTVNAGDNRQTNTSFEQDTATASDSTSGIASYAWTKQSGAGTVTFSNASTLNPTITAVSIDGTYTLRLTVTDNAGNTAWDDFTLIWDTTSPDLELTSFPDRYTNQTTTVFGFLSSETVSTPVTYTCEIDALGFNSCSSPQSYSGLTEGDHTVTIRAADSVGNTTTSTPYTWTVDTTAPVISRTGAAAVTVVQGQSYVDAGATASDTVDGTMTDDIITTNPVNTANVGSYVVRYNVTDRAGNNAAEVSRTVTVVSNADKNNDGVADAIQHNVDSFINHVSNKPVALEVDDDCTIDQAFIQAEMVHAEQDLGYDYPDGLLNFTVSCGTPGYTTTVKQYYYGNIATGAQLRKYNPHTRQYFTIDDAVITSTLVDGQPVTIATYEVTDGGPLDMDGEENGTIVDPAGLAVSVPVADNLAETGASIHTLVVTGIAAALTGASLFVVTMPRKHMQNSKLTNEQAE